ncbi:MAG: Phospholipase [Alphaproteobacteria bacterium]|nr:Phospholipase [Alphaproteobacteria bacterium]
MALIDHVVVLMLENRSFDSMLGRLYLPGPTFDGLTGDESNPWNGGQVKVWAGDATTPGLMTIPKPGTGESFLDISEQIFGDGAAPGAPATMSGFVSNYMKRQGVVPETPMHGFSPQQVPVITELARSFGVSDRWHASAPNQTWPNRFFVHTGTGGGYVNNTASHAPYKMPTIFNRLTQKKRSWRIYRHDVSHAAVLLSQIWSEVPDHLYDFNPDFLEDARTGNLPNYSFIEPRYFVLPLTSPPNDQHPSHDVGYGERLIARCYQALRTGPGWDRTLFIITYDEHGGIYDHVPPPAAVSPDGFHPNKFAFDRYGVRVPAVLISPWIPPGSVIRPPAGAHYPFDHTSILATLRNLFGLGGPLTARDAVAPDLLAALSLPAPTNDGPSHTSMPNVAAKPAELAAAEAAPPNNMQRSLAEAALKLPTGSARIPEHARLMARAAPASAPPATAGEARELALAASARFLRGPAGAGARIAPIGGPAD